MCPLPSITYCANFRSKDAPLNAWSMVSHTNIAPKSNLSAPMRMTRLSKHTEDARRTWTKMDVSLAHPLVSCKKPPRDIVASAGSQSRTMLYVSCKYLLGQWHRDAATKGSRFTLLSVIVNWIEFRPSGGNEGRGHKQRQFGSNSSTKGQACRSPGLLKGASNALSIGSLMLRASSFRSAPLLRSGRLHLLISINSPIVETATKGKHLLRHGNSFLLFV